MEHIYGNEDVTRKLREIEKKYCADGLMELYWRIVWPLPGKVKSE